MRLLMTAAVLVATLLGSPAFADGAKPAATPLHVKPQPAAPASTLSKAAWVAGYRKVLLSTWCANDLIKECWPTDDATCSAEAVKALDVCMPRLEAKLPAQLHMPDDGAIWGSAIGSCTGIEYARALQKNFNAASKRCADLEKTKY